MKTIHLLNRTYQVHPRLEGFNVNVATSTSISFFGSNPETGSMFFQFRNGGTYIYGNLTPEVRKGFWNCTSIGSFYATSIKNRFPSEKLEGAGLVAANLVPV